jgi:hypothetical protein
MCLLRSPRGDVEGNRAITTQDLLRPSISVGPRGTCLGLMEMCVGWVDQEAGPTVDHAKSGLANMFVE